MIFRGRGADRAPQPGRGRRDPPCREPPADRRRAVPRPSSEKCRRILTRHGQRAKIARSDDWQHRTGGTAMITCYLRYTIDPYQIEAVERYSRMILPLAAKYGGVHHGAFLPH